MAKIPLIIDCDPGHDDAIALMLAASASDVFDLRAVTTVGGAQSVDKTFYNARRVLTVIGLDVPVARGAAQPMVRKALGGTEIVHGESGLDGPRLPEPDLTPCNLTAFELLRGAGDHLSHRPDDQHRHPAGCPPRSQEEDQGVLHHGWRLLYGQLDRCG